MSIYGVTNSQTSAYDSISANASKTDTTKKQSETSSSAEESGVVYEPSNATESADAKSKVKDYSSIVSQLKGELSTKNEQLQKLVDQLLNKQATKYTKLSQLFEDIKSGKISVDSATVAQAQEDVSDDGYWGVTQTSDRLVSMAQALSGGDSSKADEMISAIKKGFEQATKAWGDDLPDICQQTIDAATKKLENWRDGITDAE
jgi:predicted nuclease with TOPRIM domain